MEKNKNISESQWDLMVQVLSGNADEASIAKFKDLVSANEALRFEYEALRTIWTSADNVEIPEVDVTKAWSKVQQTAQIPQTSRVIGFYPTLFKIAAVFILALGVWGVFKLSRNEVITITAQTDIKAVTLPDGSVIDLYKGATLIYDKEFNKEFRKVSLTGEAFFSIAHNKKCPFIISAAGTQIRVTGTAFMVRIDKQNVNVTVQSGSVEFKAIKEQTSVNLIKGDVGFFNGSLGKLEKQTNVDLNYDSWLTHKLSFKNAPLNEVIRAINKTYVSNISLSHGFADTMTLTATFESQTLETIQQILEKTFAIKLENSNLQSK